jgi:hypothetical protein
MKMHLPLDLPVPKVKQSHHADLQVGSNRRASRQKYNCSKLQNRSKTKEDCPREQSKDPPFLM